MTLYFVLSQLKMTVCKHISITQLGIKPNARLTLLTLSLLTSTLFLVTMFLHDLHALPTLIYCWFLGSTQPLLPIVSPSLPPQFGTHSVLAFPHSVAFLKLTLSSRPSVLRSSSRKCLRFGFWLTLLAIKDFTLITYLLTYLLT